jgi:hypothetical protein
MLLEELIKKINTGKSMLFCGAGFSRGCISANNDNPFPASDLAKKICEIGEMEIDDDLRYVSDYFIENKKNRIHELIDFMKNTYTIKKASPAVENICGHEWRRIYTTNYDNAVELASANKGLIRDAITLNDEVKTYSKQNNICVHINGVIEKLNAETFNEQVKLTQSSYISSSSFEKSGWYYIFKKDLENSNAIVFVGYSLYDIEIAKILFEGNYKEKTFFIVSEDEKKKNIYLLTKFGNVLPIGIDDFSSKLGEAVKDNEIWNECLEYFNKYQVTDLKRDIKDIEIQDFIMHGNLSSEYIDNFIVGKPLKPYLINRGSYITNALKQIKDNHNVIFYSELGNGKTIILRQLMSMLTLDGYYVIYPEDLGGNFCTDLDNLSKTHDKYIIFFDSYSRFLDVLKYIFNLNSSNFCLVLADRTNNHQHFSTIFKDYNVDVYAYDVDVIDADDELYQMSAITDNLAFWINRMDWSPERRKNFLKQDCNAQMSNILIELYDSDQIKQRIDELISPLLKIDSYKKNIFTICLLESLDLPLKESLISEIADNDEIYNIKLTNDKHFQEIFSVDQSGIRFKSPLFSLSLLQNHFDSSYIIDNLLDIAESFDSKRSEGTEQNSIFKSILRFSFVERLLPKLNKRASLVKYYENLKIRVGWLKSDPHYWLQYGMTELTYNNFKRAQQYFNTAYELIKTRPEYDSSYIDTQQARLFLSSALQESNGDIIFSSFIKGHDLLVYQQNNNYKYRQVLLYKDLYDKKFNQLSAKRKGDFLFACDQMQQAIACEKGNENFHNSDYLKEQCLTVFATIKAQHNV